MMRTHTAAALACDTDDLSPITPAAWVLDTNIVLDLWVFDDPATQPLRQALGIPSRAQGQAAEALTAPLNPPWLSTPVMREELARVLAYPHLVRRQALDRRLAVELLAVYDRCVTLCTPASKVSYTCRDKDDQKFIDLAVTHASRQSPLILLSKDHAVLRLRKRLRHVGVLVGSSWPLPSSSSAT
jgi:predicted nucleic acid-binding protein